MASLTTFLRGSKSSLSNVSSARSSRSNLSNLSNVSAELAGSLGQAGHKGYLAALQNTLITECYELTKPFEWDHASVMEVGCGKGESTRQLAERMPQVWSILGVDSDPGAVDYAFNVHADEVMDFADMNIEDSKSFDLKWGGKFDWIFSSHALLWAREQSVALRNLMWCLRPGGRCFLAVPASKPADLHAAACKVINSSTWKKFFKDIPDILSDMTDQNYNRLWFHHPNPDRVYSALLEQVGYEILKTKVIEFKYTFSCNEEYKDCVVTLMQRAVTLVPEAKRSSFVKDLVKMAKKKAPKKSKDGKITWVVNYAIVVARRPEM